MRVLNVKPLQNMASGAKFCAHVQIEGRHSTGFGKTEEAAISAARKKIMERAGLVVRKGGRR